MTNIKISLFIIITLAIFISCTKEIKETKPIKKDLIEAVFASGILEAKGTYNLTAKAEGYLVDLEIEEGDIVSLGQIVAQIDNKENYFNQQSSKKLYLIAQKNTTSMSPLLSQAKNSIKIARQKLLQDSLNFVRYKKLFDLNCVAQIEYENSLLTYNNSNENFRISAENYNNLKQQADQNLIINETQNLVNESSLSNNLIKIIVGGKVYKKLKQIGDYIRKGEVIAMIGNSQFLYAKVNIDESNISKIKLGQDVVISLNTEKDKALKGYIADISPTFNEEEQSFSCKIFFKDSLNFRIIDTQLQANIIVNKTNNALVIPAEFISFDNTVKIKGKEQPQKVITGCRSNNWVQILTGIDETTILETDNIN